jgi:2-oxoglutarate ferredoxin oxidoreductase subunit gamma
VKTELRITGLGGQGAITTGLLLGRAAALYDSKEAVVTEGYSPYITGGWSRADVIISDQPIDYPAVSRLDVLVTMYQEGLDLNLRLLKQNGLVIVEDRLVNFAKAGQKRSLQVPGLDIAEKLGKSILANVVILGALAGSTGVVSIESIKKALADRFPKAVELNLKALDAGVDFASAASEGRREILA